jgi:hypothetical protein
MTQDDTFEVPFDADSDTTANPKTKSKSKKPELSEQDAAEVAEAKEAWDGEAPSGEESSADPAADVDGDQDDPKLVELAQPFVGQWNSLISTTNWEKGRIISEWREALIETDADATQYSDEAWARRVGGVTAPHVGRLRRVFDRFGSTYETYKGVYWSHFLAALDWEDAPMWLEGASQESWSVSGMREKRWQAQGAVESQRPTNSQIVEVDTDEDVVLPAQGGGRTKEYGDEPGVASGKVYDDPDFGDEEELMSLAGGAPGAAPSSSSEKEADSDSAADVPVQPFAGLPELPDDLADAIEAMKLAILRHKTAGWVDVDSETVDKYLAAIAVMMK